MTNRGEFVREMVARIRVSRLWRAVVVIVTTHTGLSYNYKDIKATVTHLTLAE